VPSNTVQIHLHILPPKATLAARRAEKHGNVADNLNPKLLYASMPPRARRAIERRLSSMLSSKAVPGSSGSNAHPGVNDTASATGKVTGSRRYSDSDDVQKTNRGRVTGTVLAKSSAKAQSVGNTNAAAAAMAVDTSNGGTPTSVRKKRSRRMRVKHRRGNSGRKGKKKNRRSLDKEVKSSHVTSTVNKSKIHAREDHAGATGSIGDAAAAFGHSQDNNCSDVHSHAPTVHVSASADVAAPGTTFQGSYAAAYLRQAPSGETTKNLTAALVKSLAQGQSTAVPRPGASKNVSNFLSSSVSPAQPHPPKHHAGAGSDVVWIARNNGTSKSGILGRPLAMNSYSSGGAVHHRSVHSPHLRQYRTSNVRSNAVVSPRDHQLASSMDGDVTAESMGRMVRQRPYSSSGTREGGGASGSGPGNQTPEASSSIRRNRSKFSHSSAVGEAAAAAAARRGGHNRISTKRFLPNLEGSGGGGGGGDIDRERWGLAFSPIVKVKAGAETST
jgi:hypothetical protein